MINLLNRLFNKFSLSEGNDSVRAVAVLGCLLAYSTTGYMYFELPGNPSLQWLDAFWWSIVTMTTVGYGDLFPTTTAGRILIAFPTMLVGIAVLGYFLSLIASHLLERKLKELRGMNPVEDTDHLILCNYTGADATLEILGEIRRDPSTANAIVVLIDPDLEELPRELATKLKFVRGEPAREDVLRQANLDAAQAVIIRAKLADADASDNYNLRIGLTIETLRRDVHTVVECRNPANVAFFERAGCDSVVCLAALSDRMIVQELHDPGLADVVAELSSNQHGKQFYLMPATSGATFQEQQTTALAKGVVAFGIRRAGKNLLLPSPDTTSQAGDLLITVAAERPQVS